MWPKWKKINSFNINSNFLTIEDDNKLGIIILGLNDKKKKKKPPQLDRIMSIKL